MQVKNSVYNITSNRCILFTACLLVHHDSCSKPVGSSDQSPLKGSGSDQL